MRLGIVLVHLVFVAVLPSACDGDDGTAPVDRGICGDAVCAGDETDASCPGDCGCSADLCSDELAAAPYGCHCDSLCAANGDCCADVDVCEAQGSGVVIPVYLTATDTPAGDVEKVRAAYEDMFGWVQTWYMLEMKDHGFKTFRVEPVRVFPSPHTRAQWDTYSTTCYPGQDNCDGSGGCSMWYAANKLLPPLLAGAGLPPIGSEGTLYYVIGGAGTNGSCGGGGLAASEEKVVTLNMANCPTGHYRNGGTDCAMVGVITHEQGHAFGLPHAADRPGGCTGGPSVMDVWWDYDRGATLCEEDRVDLEKSGYFH